jgi:isopentenyldiphosphate isomerase
MARIPIVDENDNILEYKERESILPADIYRVAGLWVVDGKGRALFARRAWSKKKGPGKWGPSVAGTVEEGETYEQNIIKEAQEELGLENIVPAAWIKLRTARAADNYFGQWFMVVRDVSVTELRPDPREVAEVKWMSRTEFIDAVKHSPDEFLEGTRGLLDKEPEYLDAIFSYS